jgi:hypothetical protein
LLPFRFVDVIVITVHDLFWNVGQANCILKYFENMKNVYFSNMKKVIKHYPMTGRLTVTRVYMYPDVGQGKQKKFARWIFTLIKYLNSSNS